MDLRSLYEREKAGFSGYCIPASLELAGKCLDIAFDGGEQTRLAFSPNPARDVTVSDGAAYPYKCAKIGSGMFFVSFTDGAACTSFVIDNDEGSVTRIVAGADAKTELSFGTAASGQTGIRHTVTDDFAGNAFEWTFGPEAVNIVAAKYGADAVTVSFPFAGADAPTVAVSDFTAVRLVDGVYLQSAAVTIDGQVFSAALAADFVNLLCVGGIFGVHNGSITHRIIGGHGKAVML